MNVLIIGGAGYIGSITNQFFLENGVQTTVLDNLSRGHREALVQGTKFVHGDLASPRLLEGLFRQNKFDGVLHFAADSLVQESQLDPLTYYRNNVANTINLLAHMKQGGVKRFIFSSSAAVYGNPSQNPVTESHPMVPINPYGRTKQIIENILEDVSRVDGLCYVSLRYFNAAGAHPNGSLGEAHEQETHLIPSTFNAIMRDREPDEKPVIIYGSDYPTPDGTCVRDYVHVLDLAQAHFLAFQYLVDHEKSEVFNLGSGTGYSVLEIIESIQKVAGKKIYFDFGKRRDGDPPVLVADNKKITTKLGWMPRLSGLNTIIKTAWKWHRNPSFNFQQADRGIEYA